MPKKKISVVVPVFNEAAGFVKVHESIVKVMDSLKKYDYELVYIEDGSDDNSAEVVQQLAAKNKRVITRSFTRNFGKEMATTAGIRAATGDAVMLVDADGQHPPEMIPEFVKKWEEGNDVVIGVRTANQKEGPMKKYGSLLFYFLLRRLGVKDITPGATDFRIIDRVVVDEFNQLTDHNRVTRALIDWLGFKKTTLEFTARARQHGEAGYTFKKLFNLALGGFVSLSFTPLYLAGYLGAFITVLSLITTAFFVIESYLFGDPLQLNITGTAYLALLVVFLVGIVLSCQGLLSIYIAQIYTETQNRPLYVFRKSRK